MTSELDQQVIAFVQRIVAAMGLELQTTLEETADHIRLNLSGDGAEVSST